MDTWCIVKNMSQQFVPNCWEEWELYDEELIQWASQFQEPQPDDDGYNFYIEDIDTFQKTNHNTKSLRSKKETRSDFHRGKESRAKIPSNRSKSHNHAERDWGKQPHWFVVERTVTSDNRLEKKIVYIPTEY